MARMGFDSPTYGADGKDYNATQYGGYGGRIVPGGPTTANGTDIPISTGAQDAVNRYQGLGAAAGQRGAYQANFGLANQDRQQGLDAREQQKDALQLQRGAALGQAPSRAEIAGAQAGGQSLDATLTAGAGSRGMGGAAAQMLAQRGQGAGQLGAQAGAMGGRSNEMGHAISAYGQGATNIRSGDYATMGLDQQQAEAQAQSEMAQRQLNDRMQLSYEQRGYDVNNDELQRNLTQQQIYAQEYATRSAAQQHRSDTNLKVAGSLLAAGGGATAAASGGGGGGGGGSSGGGGDPYSNDVSTSDARAKQEAYDLGVARGLSAGPEVRNAPAGITGVRANQNKPTEGRAASTSMARAAMAQQAPGFVAGAKQAVERGLDKAMYVAKPDPMTDAVADGLAPHAWKYKPEYAQKEGQQPGEQNVGIIAQNAAGNPITGTIVKPTGDGMMGIDQRKATSLALAAAGHNAQRLREQQAQIDQFKGVVR